MRVVDYIANRLVRETDAVFMLAGGGAMFLNDALSWHPELRPIFCHNEQTCAMAAEAYARFNKKLGVVNVTTGPGGINAMNGVFGAWTDSIPMLVISGQVKCKTTLRATGNVDKLRQLGDQEVDIISLVKPITKDAIFVSDIDEIPFVLEKAIRTAFDGRPGPVWLDIPIDIQSAEINPEKYFLCSEKVTSKIVDGLSSAVRKVSHLISQSKRPIFLAGSGIRASGSEELLYKASKKFNIPVCASWTSVDVFDFNDELFAERPGVVGTRAGNLIAQRSDLIIVLGSRLPIRQVSYNWENFGKNAIKVGVDIDSAELSKPMVSLDILVNSDLKNFLECLLEEGVGAAVDSNWVDELTNIKRKYPPIEITIKDKGHSADSLNPYLFVSEIWPLFRDDEIIACADASASVIPFQVAPIKNGQRIFTNAGSASMGYELPAAIGAAIANPSKRIICMAGDGSIMLNIQELETIYRYNLPIKILLLNNLGYLSIKLSQNGFFGREKGAGISSGLGFPDFKKLAEANRLPYCCISDTSHYDQLNEFLDLEGPVFIEVKIDPSQSFEPKLGSYKLEDGKIVSNSLENMTPLLPEDELIAVMKGKLK